MTFAITKVECYGIEAEEAVNKRYRQLMTLTITAANTDTAWDLGSYISGSLGTFWTAVSGSTIGANALTAIRDICTRASHYVYSGGEQLAARQRVDPTAVSVVAIDSAVSVGGSATEAYTVTGLLTTDSILSVVQFVDGAGAGVGILSFGNASGQAAAANALSVVYNADPGAGAKVRVVVSRVGAAVAPAAGQYAEVPTNKAPNLTFSSGDAPTTAKITIEWWLNAGHPPVEYYA